jgi:hypothetical protein
MSLQPGTQRVVHPPERQMGSALIPEGHTIPQLPQLFGSLSVETHVPSQFILSAGHSRTHDPSLQASAGSHGLSQPPQCS